uniref:Ig-like domain-containing protein n=1 Tax=Periophthalmus magnuspinnatus TaxID=409849 RepID=A0A3B4B3S4_9GOBI
MVVQTVVVPLGRTLLQCLNKERQSLASFILNFTLCRFNSSDLKDIEYVYSEYYNRVEFLRFSSRVDWYTGYTEFGLREANIANNDTDRLTRRRMMKQHYCLQHVHMWYKNALNRTMTPEAVLTSTAPSGGSQRLFTCSTFGFFPRSISISWTINQQPHTSEVSSTDTLPDGDWLYQAHSQLSYSPRFRDRVSCWVEHAALRDALEVPWEPVSHGDRNKIAIGISGSVLGLVLALSGVLYYCKRRKGIHLHQVHG